MEIGTNVTLYCLDEQYTVEIECPENGIFNGEQVHKVCSLKGDCIREMVFLQNLRPRKQGEPKWQINGSKRKYVCKENPKKAVIYGLFYNKLYLKCYYDRLFVLNISKVYSNGVIQCQGPL